MKIKFRGVKLSKNNKVKLFVVNSIIEEYQEQNYILTLRQLYYQLVSRDIIPNSVSEYSKLSILLKEGRMGGFVDWDAIEDRLRQPYKPPSFNSPIDILNTAIKQYAINRMGGQETYLEVWIEKDALSGVLKRVTSKYHIPILVNRGYSSVSAMYDAFTRFSVQGWNKNKHVKVLYLGDFDPSGLDMIRDVESRIIEFKNGSKFMDKKYIFNVKSIALTIEQIEFFKPPPNPAKKTDPRAKDFIKKYGSSSWEVDALKPELLHNLLEKNILKNIDVFKYKQKLIQEVTDKSKLTKLKQFL